MSIEISKKGTIKALKSVGMTRIEAKDTAKGMNLSRRMNKDQIESRIKTVIDKEGKEMEFEGLSSKGATGLRKKMLKKAQEGSAPTKPATKEPEKTLSEKRKGLFSRMLGIGGENPNPITGANLAGTNVPNIQKPTINQQNNALVTGANLTNKDAKKSNSSQFEATSNQTPGFGIKRKNSGKNEPPAMAI